MKTDHEEELDILSEEELEMLAGEDAPPEPPASLVKVTKATDTEIANFAQDIFEKYPGFVSSCNPTLVLLDAMQRSRYLPHRSLLVGANLPDVEDISRMQIASGLASKQMLDDLAMHFAQYAEEHPEAIESKGVEVIETDEGGMAYVEGKVDVEKSYSESKEGWASW